MQSGGIVKALVRRWTGMTMRWHFQASKLTSELKKNTKEFGQAKVCRKVYLATRIDCSCHLLSCFRRYYQRCLRVVFDAQFRKQTLFDLLVQLCATWARICYHKA